MKKTSILPLFFILFAFIYSLTHLSSINQITERTFFDTLHLFYSIFFWIFLFSLSTKLGLFEKIGRFISPILSPICHLTSIECAIYLASIFSGYPTYAKLIYDHHLNNERALHLMKFCSHPSIGFVVINLGEGVFHNVQIGYHLFFIQVLSNFILAILCRKKTMPVLNTGNIKKFNLMMLIKEQLKSSIEVFIYIFGFMLVFRILEEAIPFEHFILQGVFEFSQGCLSLTNSPFEEAFVGCSFFLSFSGFSVICQAISLLNVPSSFLKIVVYRFLQGVISVLLSYLYLQFLN